MKRYISLYFFPAVSLSLWAALFAAFAGAAVAQTQARPSLGLFGTPGLIDMPTASATPDAQISVTVAHFRGISRTTIGFQLTPHILAAIRYSAHGNPTYNYDRSLDFSYHIMDERGVWPSLAVGMRDVLGTGWYSGEYLVATKSLGSRVKITGGLGWGRLGSYNSFKNPLSVFGSGFNTRPTGTLGMGGIPAYNKWFRGPAAFFGGVQWQTPINRLLFKAEYSSDAYTRETSPPIILKRRSSLNFALTYQFKNGASLSGYYIYGDRIGFSGSITLNPKNPANASSIGPAPQPVLSRPNDRPYDTTWTKQRDGANILRQNMRLLLKREGLGLEGFTITATRAEVWFSNARFGAASEAIGRVARAMSQALPDSVETFVIIPVVKGMAVVSVTLKRSDIERFEYDPNAAEKIYAHAVITDAAPLVKTSIHDSGLYPRFIYAIGPYAKVSLFDPTNPFRADIGVRVKGKVTIRPGLILSGSIRKRVVGNLDKVTRVSNSIMPHVRSDSALYDIKGDPALEYLTAEYFFRPGRNLYGRISVGYLEEMYGGLASELLWKPVNSQFALGLEVNAVRKRAYNQLLGFRSYRTVTARGSIYWDMGNGFFGQIAAGRYLAGDYGATFTLDRVFDNGWKIGAYFTLTNVSATTFGEGSFDKGLLITIPMAWWTGRPSPKAYVNVMQPLTRDGGARVEVRNRLYGLVENYQDGRLKRRWGEFWR